MPSDIIIRPSKINYFRWFMIYFQRLWSSEIYLLLLWHISIYTYRCSRTCSLNGQGTSKPRMLEDYIWENNPNINPRCIIVWARSLRYSASKGTLLKDHTVCSSCSRAHVSTFNLRHPFIIKRLVAILQKPHLVRRDLPPMAWRTWQIWSPCADRTQHRDFINFEYWIVHLKF